MSPRRLGAEFLGTLWLVLGGCGSAVLAGKLIGAQGVALAFGLTVLTGAYALGGISGGHFNPAVTIGLWVAKKFDGKDVAPYIAAQILGGVGGAGIIAAIAKGKPGFQIDDGSAGRFATNGFGKWSPGGYRAGAAFVCELVLTAVFLLLILGATHKRAAAGFAPIAIGLGLTLIHLISIPVTNTSVNPARSTSQALFVGGDAVGQLWLFWVAPILGAAVAGIVWSAMFDSDEEVVG